MRDERTMTDYFARLAYEVRDEGDGARVLYADRSALFKHLPSDAVRPVINEAMEIVVPYFTANTAKSGLVIEPHQVEEAAFRVAVWWICMYHSWRTLYPQHRDRSLSIGADELRSASTFDQCYDYCKGVFGADFRRYTAALLGLTDKQYTRIEKRRQEYWNK